MWRIEERRCGADWQTVDTERLERLQLNLSDQATSAERAAAWDFDSRHDLQGTRLALRDAAVTDRPVGHALQLLSPTSGLVGAAPERRTHSQGS